MSWPAFSRLTGVNMNTIDETKLFDVLDVIGEETRQRFPYVNCGGCGVFATYVARGLRDIVGLSDVGIRVGPAVVHECLFTPEEEEEAQVRLLKRLARRSLTKISERFSPKTAVEWDIAGILFGHLVVEFTLGRRKYIYDAHGVQRYKRTLVQQSDYVCVLYHGRITIEQCEIIIQDPGAWNDSWDRQDNKHVALLVKRHLSKLKQVDNTPAIIKQSNNTKVRRIKYERTETYARAS